MPLPVVSAFAYLIVAASIGLLIGQVFAGWAGWAFFSAGLATQLAYHLRHFLRIEAWSRHPAVSTSLVGYGAWDEVFARLYRHERDLHQEIEQQRQQVLLFAHAGQALLDGLVSIDRNGRIEWCNNAAEVLLEIDRRSDIGQPLGNLVRQPEFLTYLAQGDFAKPLRMAMGRDGERILSVHVVPYGGNRRLVQVRDVTQAERIDAMRRDFVANVSHELRTPLTVLSGFVETLRDLDFAPEDRSRYFGMMAEQSRRMQQILEELLTLSNLEAAPPPPATERVDMRQMLAKLDRDARALSGDRHDIVLEIAGEGDLLGAEVEIASALSNLVSNAIRYTPAGGRVTLSWQADRRGAEFAVSDTGIGIDPRHIPRLTERFYRVDRSRSRETGGTGLGLAIVKHALSRHQATLEIHSTPGRGSRFAARFPAVRVVL